LLSRQGHGPTGVAGGRLQLAATVAGRCGDLSPIAGDRGHRAISVQGTASLVPAEAAIELAILFQNVLFFLVRGRTGTLWE